MLGSLLSQLAAAPGPRDAFSVSSSAPGMLVFDFSCAPPLFFAPPLSGGAYWLEVLFCQGGGLRAAAGGSSHLSLRPREVLLISGSAVCQSLNFGKERFCGVLVAITRDGAQHWLDQLYPPPVRSPQDAGQALAALDARGGWACLPDINWTQAAFSILDGLPCQERGRFCALKAMELLYLLYCGSPLLPSLPIPEYRDPFQVDAVKRVHAYMMDNLSQPLTISELSRRFSIPPTSLKSCFQQVYGQSIHRCLQGERMRRAAELLVSTSLPIVQVALQVGYASVSQFGAAFKFRYHMTPSQYRRRRGQKNV